MNLEKQIKQILNQLGIRISLKGYKYWIEAVEYVIESNKIVFNITHEIYPYIANKYNDKSSRVERALRHAYESSKETIQEYFGVSYKITNAELLALIVDKIKMEMEEEKERKS